jgi:hypothetical protein
MIRSKIVIFGGLTALALTSALPSALAGASTTPAANSIAAGYAVALKGGSESYSGVAKVPTVTCTSADKGILLIGEDISDTLSAGKDGEVALEIGMACSGTTPLYGATIDINGTTTKFGSTVSAGDTLSFTASASSSKVTGKATDTTTKKSTSATGAGGTLTAVIVGAGGISSGWPIFSTIAFSKVMLNGKPLSSAEPTQTDAAVMVSGNWVTEITSSALNKSGGAFHDTYVTNNPS